MVVAITIAPGVEQALLFTMRHSLEFLEFSKLAIFRIDVFDSDPFRPEIEKGVVNKVFVVVLNQTGSTTFPSFGRVAR